MQSLDRGVWIRHIYKLAEIEQLDKALSEFVPLECQLCNRVAIGELGDEQTSLTSDLQRDFLVKELQCHLVNFYVRENPVLRRLLSICELRKKVQGSHHTTLRE